jgi:polar amino acid transport system permease protein
MTGRPRAASTSGRQRDGRSIVIAAASTIVVFGLLGWVIVSSPNWPEVRDQFFDPRLFWESLGDVLVGDPDIPGQVIPPFWKNIVIALIAEGFILVVALGLAIARGAPGPAFAPLRILATAYVDLFRAVPGIVIIFALGFGVPALGLPGVPNDPTFWAIVTLTLLYSAYVSEVYRAGLESIHPSQEAAARSLGLSRIQALRYVLVPQAVRRVVPPLLNDFIGLTKDTVLVSFIGVVEIFRTAQIKNAATFNFTPYVAVAVVFIIVTIPMARLVDRLAARDKARAQAGVR